MVKLLIYQTSMLNQPITPHTKQQIKAGERQDNQAMRMSHSGIMQVKSTATTRLTI